MHLDHVARGAGIRRDDRRFAPRDAIEQRRLAGIGRPGDRHHQAVAQPFAAAARRRARRRSRLRSWPRDGQRRPDQILRHIGLVGEIDRALRSTPAP